MPRYKVTLGFAKHTMGPSETYISPVVTAGTATQVLQDLITKRNEMLFETVQWTGVRISQEGVKRRSVFYPPGTYNPFTPQAGLVVPPKGLKTASAVTLRPDQTRACLHVRLTYDTDRRVIRYFNFPPDAITHDEPAGIHWSADTSYGQKFDAFWTHLVTLGWSLRARDYGSNFPTLPITNWVQSSTAPTNLGIVVASLPAPGLTVRDTVSIQGVRRRGTDKESYNGQYVIHAVNTTLVPDSIVYYLRGTEGGDPYSIRLTGTVQKVGHTYHPIQGYEAVRVGTHKRGKPLGTPSGRRAKRVRLGS